MAAFRRCCCRWFDVPRTRTRGAANTTYAGFLASSGGWDTVDVYLRNPNRASANSSANAVDLPASPRPVQGAPSSTGAVLVEATFQDLTDLLEQKRISISMLVPESVDDRDSEGPDGLLTPSDDQRRLGARVRAQASMWLLVTVLSAVGGLLLAMSVLAADSPVPFGGAFAFLMCTFVLAATLWTLARSASSDS